MVFVVIGGGGFVLFVGLLVFGGIVGFYEFFEIIEWCDVVCFLLLFLVVFVFVLIGVFIKLV